MKKFEVVAIHFTTNCQMDCPYCYRKKSKKQKNFEFWYELVPYLKKYTNQIACGGGEPFLYPEFIKKLGGECKKNKIKLNITTNGKLLDNFDCFELADILKDVNMVSISIDDYKLTKWKNIASVNGLISRLKRISPKVIFGINYLNLDNDFNKIRSNLNKLNNADRFYLLTPKNVLISNILKFKAIYMILSKNYPLYVDDLSKQILTEGKLDNWKNPCHGGIGLISINERGIVSSCSFDNTGVLKLNKPEDIKKIEKIKFIERYSCPYNKMAKC